MNVSTVEDPVEYTLEGITQTQVHEKIGMTFAMALRALLRQDPDVILLGEIRDHGARREPGRTTGVARRLVYAGRREANGVNDFQWIDDPDVLRAVLAGDLMLGRWLAAWGDAWLCGMIGAIFVAFRPQWLATYADRIFTTRFTAVPGGTRITDGDFAEGWRQYEWRSRTRELKGLARDFAAPRWTGAEDLAGRTILLHAEQGFGDTLQFVRYAELAAAAGARVLLEVQRPLLPLLAGLAGVEAMEGKSKKMKRQAGALKRFPMHYPVKGLYQVGAWTFPGGGYMGAVLSARVLVDRFFPRRRGIGSFLPRLFG